MSQSSDYKYTVLTIEDENSVRKSIKAHLEDYCYKVLEAENGENGIKIFQSEKPDVVLVDLKMPGIHGLDVIKIISSMSEITPVIVVSGSGEIQTAIDSIHNGASDYILKPIIDLKILNRSIDKCIKRSREKRQELLYRQHLEDELMRKSEEIERKNYLLSELNKHLDKIINSAFSLSKNRRLKDFGSQILEDFGNHLKASGGSIYVKEESGLRLIHTIEPRHSPDFLPFPLNEKSPLTKVLNFGKPVLIDNLDNENELNPSGWDGYKDSSFMIFPLPDQDGNVMGLLSLHNKTQPPFITEDKELGLLMSVFYKEANRSMNSIEALHLSESRLKHLTENSAAVIFSFSIESGSFDFINNSFERLTGYSKDKVLNRGLTSFIETAGIIESENVVSHFEDLITGMNSGGGLDYRITTSEGGIKWVFQKTVVIFNRDGIPVTIDGIITDYSEQKEVEEQLKDLLDQKGFLLNEINHRVKNNMQIISSLINLQLEMHDDEKSRDSLIAAGNRITSLALVHDNLYNRDFIPTINMSGYIKSLIHSIVESMAKLPNIKVNIEVSDTNMDIDRALLCGLIVNESVSNSLVHAFPDNKGGTVTIELNTEGNYYYLDIRDTGTGFELSEKNGKTKGIGIDIIKSLGIQLEGELEFKNDKGTIVSLRFPVTSPRRERKYYENKYL